MPGVEQTDEQIAYEVQKGDIESFGLLMGRYEQKMIRYARKFLFRGDDVDDMVQDVFIKAYVNIKSLDTTRRFSPWLYRIAHNEFISAIRKKGRDRLMFLDLDLLFPHLRAKETADGDLHNQELQQMLNNGLSQLSPKYREPLVLYYSEEMNYKEIADILKIPAATVGVRLNRGKQLLKKIIRKP